MKVRRGNGRSLLHVVLVLEEADFTRYWDGVFRHLDARDVEMTFVSVRNEGPLHDVIEELGHRHVALGAKSSRDYPAAIWKLRRTLRKRRFDVLHASEAIQASVGGAAALRLPNVTRVFHRHHLFIRGSYRWYSRLGSKLSHGTIAVSHEAARLAEKDDGVPPQRVRVVHNGLPAFRRVGSDEIVRLRRELGLAEGARVIAQVGIVRPEKGHRLTLRALEQVVDQIDEDVHLLVVGTDPIHLRDPSRNSATTRDLIRFIRERGMTNVHLVGFQRDVAPWYALADVVAMPSLDESFGLVAVESMSLGIPVVASRVGGLQEVVDDNGSGLLVEPGDSKSLADALVRILRDRGLGNRFGINGQERYLELFSTDAMVSGWLSSYEDFRKLHEDQTRR